MKLRVGIEGNRKPVMEKVRQLGAPILVSANSLWNDRTKTFSKGWIRYRDFDVALDSGGFVAMKLFGGYRWTIPQYVQLAASMKPTWWAQMDFCCEPQIAASHTEVLQRISRTVKHLQECQRIADGENVPPPMPVLQGWNPEDYCHGPIYDLAPDCWPALVGVGSVCRRSVNGTTGILSVVAALDQHLPRHTKLHLFGVKSSALSKLVTEFPNRIESADSMAWNMAARFSARDAQTPCTNEYRAASLHTWFLRQKDHIQPSPQLTFTF